MKFSKASIIITLITFIIFGVSVANLFMSISSGQSLVLSVGIAVVMLGVFIACLATAIKDAKKNGASSSDDDDDEDSIDDEDDED